MKNKKLILGIVVIAIISGLIATKYFNKSSSTVKGNQMDFSIKDTASITKFFIADMFNNQVTVEKNNEGIWMVDNKHLANKNMVNTLLSTMNLITIKAPVSKSKYDMVVRYMASTGIKAEFYSNNETTPSKVVFLGPSNQNHTGSYMMLENSNSPYLMHIEGFYGFLNPRFSPYLNEWRDKLVANYTPKEIKTIQIANPSAPDKDFILRRNEASGEVAIALGNGSPLPNIDTLMVFDYLDRFKGINFESWEETKTPMFIDSVRKSQPESIIQITDINNQTTKVALYKKPLDSPFEMDDELITEDQDRLYAVINDDEFVVMQYFVLDPINISIDMFKKQ